MCDPKFKQGDDVFVWDDNKKQGRKGKFISECRSDIGLDPYIAHVEDIDNSTYIADWKNCEPLKPDWPVDHPVWVRFAGSEKWVSRCFAGWTEDGDIFCWDFGRNSHTAESPAHKTRWNFYTDVDPNK